MQYASYAVRLPFVAVLLVLAVPCALMVWRSRQGRLHRAGRLGLHTPAAVASEEAFAVANRVATPLVAGAVAVGVACAAVTLAVPVGTAGAVIAGVLGLAGVFGQLYAASSLGERAAMTVPRPARRSSAGGCCGSCNCGGSGCTGGANGSAADGSAAGGATNRAPAGSDIPDLVADATTVRA